MFSAQNWSNLDTILPRACRHDLGPSPTEQVLEIRASMSPVTTVSKPALSFNALSCANSPLQLSGTCKVLRFLELDVVEICRQVVSD